MNIGILGAGTMGRGIAQVMASTGHKVLIYDQNHDEAKRALNFIAKMLSRMVEKNKITQAQQAQINQNITIAKEIHQFNNSELIIESVIEQLHVKQAILNKIENIISAECVLGSNTSSLSLSAIAGGLKHPERFLGIHFFNPAPLMPLVELIPTQITAKKILSGIKSMLSSINKVVVIAKDTPGFIVNRIVRSFYLESFRIYEEGIADFAMIDWAMKTFGKFKMGPFELTDLIGQDVNYTVSETVFRDLFFDTRFTPSIVQKRMMQLNLLGKKTGKGFYQYDENAKKIAVNHDKDVALGNEIFNRVLAMLINEAIQALYLNIASKDDLDKAVRFGVNYPKGLLKWCDEIGAKTVQTTLQNLYENYQEERYRISPLLRKYAKENTLFYS